MKRNVRNLLLLAPFLATLGGAPAHASTTAEHRVTAEPAADAKAQVGTASRYGRAHAGRKTASGARFDPEAMTCAHRTLPLGSVVKVTNIATGRHVSVTVTDRGPYIRGRIVDLSDKAARQLGVGDKGVLRVSVEVTTIARAAEPNG